MAANAAVSKKRKRATNPQPKKAKSKAPAVECPICLEPTKPSQIIKISKCSCECCKSCLREAFSVGLIPSNFPARCCGHPLNLDAHEKQLTPSLRRAYHSKIEENQNNNPLYCANTECGEYLLESARRDKFVTCGMCHKKTCVECKTPKGDHLGIHSVCPREADELREVGEREGWQRCPRCYCLVEKVSGCDEIRCRCKAYFCYACGRLTETSTRDDAEKCVCRVSLIEVFPLEELRNVAIVVEPEDELPPVEELLRSRIQSPALPAEFPD